MTLEEIKEAKATQDKADSLFRHRCFQVKNWDLYLENMCIELAQKYFQIDTNTFLVYIANYAYDSLIFNDSYKNKIENFFYEKSKEFTNLESIEFYEINHIVFNKNDNITY